MDNLPKELVKGSEASSILSGKTEQGRSRILHVEWKALWGKQGFSAQGQAEVGGKSLGALLKVKGVLGTDLS